MNQRKKVVAVGLYVPGTGFTRVLTSLFSRLKHKYKTHWLGIGYKGAVQKINGYTLYPTNLEGGDIYAAYQMKALIQKLDAEIVFLLNDFWMLKNYKNCLDELKSQVTTFAYIPLDGKIDEPAAVRECVYLDHLICYNRFSISEVTKAFDSIAKEDPQMKFPVCHEIPHGIDLSNFFPLKERALPENFLNRKKIKDEIFPAIDNEDSFVILNANRISERKALHLSLEAFSNFSKEKSNAYLCLHLPNSNEHQLKLLGDQIREYRIEKQVIINPLGSGYCSNETLNELYNACDVGLNTSLGEGWGMIAFEHAATGAVQIVPAHTACKELWEDAGLVIEVDHWKKLTTNPFLMGHISVDHLTQLLEDLFADKNLLHQKSKMSFQKAISSQYDWTNIAGVWNDLFEKCA